MTKRGATRKQSIGIALMLMGLIVTQYPELAAWTVGLIPGPQGL